MVYVTSDLHGYPLEKFKDFLEKAGFSDDDFLYILGDVIDRGEDGIKILKWLMSKHNAELLLGNHEAMLLACDFLFDEITDETILDLCGSDLVRYRIWMSNGGQPTVNALTGMGSKEIEYILEYLQEAPLYETVTVNGRDFVLVHGGLGGFRKGKKLAEYSSRELLWTRPETDTRYYDDVTVIFGHTPTFHYGEEYLGLIIRTDTWIDVDVGVGIGQGPVLLRLDDMKEIYYDSLCGSEKQTGGCNNA